MTDPAIRETIERLYASGHKLVYEFTGAGSLALAWLHSVGGSSRMLLEASDRYSPESLRQLLGHTPEKAVSELTAHWMASRAYRRAVRLSDGASACIGLSCTATVATDRTKRGEHACHVAVRNRAGLASYEIILAKGQRDRLGEETFVAGLILHALANACGVPAPEVGFIAGEKLITVKIDSPDAVHELLDDRLTSVRFDPNGNVATNEPFDGALLSGSFNPLHCGHETMLRVAGRFLNLPTAYELPIVNADKPALSPHEIQRRVDQFRRVPVILTRVPLFSEKAKLFPGCTFVVGYDTATRLVDPRYYEGEAGRDAALASIRQQGCRFLVAARPMPEGVRTLADVDVPAGFETMFIELPVSHFLLDLSSTQLRAGA